MWKKREAARKCFLRRKRFLVCFKVSGKDGLSLLIGKAGQQAAVFPVAAQYGESGRSIERGEALLKV